MKDKQIITFLYGEPCKTLDTELSFADLQKAIDLVEEKGPKYLANSMNLEIDNIGSVIYQSKKDNQ